MLTLAKLGRGREDYYLRAVGADASQYYSEQGEVAGLWLGGGTAELGLRGRVEDAALLALLAGYEPGALQQDGRWIGQRLVAPPGAGKRMPGIDACFKAPKSVSLLWAFGDRIQLGDRTLDRVIEAAHDEAVREAMAYLENAAAKGRRGHNGVDQMDSSGFVAATFRQRTSRANDPHVHTHVVIANMCRRSDGRWGALDARLLYVHAKTAGYLYESHLRHRLTADLGLEWTAVENGIADVVGVGEDLLTLFSKRSREIYGRLDEVTERINAERIQVGLEPVEADSVEALDIAARQTRAAKLKHVATDDLRTDWHGQAAAARLAVDGLSGVLDRVEPQSMAADPEQNQRVAAHLTENASTFGQRDAIQGMAADARSGLPVADVLERTSRLLASPEVLPVIGVVRDQDVIRRADGIVAPVPTGERRWSTPEMLAVEERLVASTLRRRDEGAAVVPAGLLRESLGSSLEHLPTLGADQLEIVAGLASSGAGVECVEAAPGTGKTTALGVYVAACRVAGIPVIGCAPSARARDELRLGAQIGRCYTVDKLLLELRRSSLEPGSVVILDEASMAGSRKLERLLAIAEANGTKVVLVGDTKQLSSVDAGGGFRGLVARLGAHQLLENRRQVEQWERDALQNLRDGRVRQAMTAYAAHGRLRLGDHGDLLDRMVADWWVARPEGEAVMQASRWADVLTLNERARELMVGAGLVERDGLDVRGQTIGVGDQVMVLRNAPALGVINGTTGTITAVDRDGGDLYLRVAEAEPRTVRLPAQFCNAKGRRRVVLAYCRTVHKAQGSTYRGSSFTLAGDETIHFEATHVALSRATVANHLYYSGEPPPDEDHHSPEIEAPEFEGLVAAVGRSRAQVMALDLLSGLTDAPGVTSSSGDGAVLGSRLAELPMTEKQVAVLARRNALPDRDLTWVQASLLIDAAREAPRGRQATAWLREKGVSSENAAKIVELAERELRSPSHYTEGDAVEARLEALEATPARSNGAASELAALRRQRAAAAIDRVRQRRLAWAQQSSAADAPYDAQTEHRSRRIAR
jgi:conjugative relaxase-like TrwC/TraI family protein